MLFGCLCVCVFFLINLFKKSFRNTIRVTNNLVTEQAQCFVRPDLGPNCFLKVVHTRSGKATVKCLLLYERICSHGERIHSFFFCRSRFRRWLMCRKCKDVRKATSFEKIAENPPGIYNIYNHFICFCIRKLAELKSWQAVQSLIRHRVLRPLI